MNQSPQETSGLLLTHHMMQRVKEATEVSSEEVTEDPQKIYERGFREGRKSVVAKKTLPLVISDVVVGYVSINTDNTFGFTFYEDPISKEVEKLFISGEANCLEIGYVIAGRASLDDYQAQMRLKSGS